MSNKTNIATWISVASFAIVLGGALWNLQGRLTRIEVTLGFLADRTIPVVARYETHQGHTHEHVYSGKDREEYSVKPPLAIAPGEDDVVSLPEKEYNMIEQNLRQEFNRKFQKGE